MLLIGGEKFHGQSGKAETIVDEYDVETDLYYCLERLPWPYYGGGLGIHDGIIHVVGGAEWVGHSASRRVQLYDLRKAPSPRQCFYDPVPVFDQWERTWNKVKPWNDIENKVLEQAHAKMRKTNTGCNNVPVELRPHVPRCRVDLPEE